MSGSARPHGSWAGERVLVLSPTPSHPQDFGNRKRIFRICSNLKDEGAEITFVHYPAEAEWRHSLPWRAEQAMSRTWSQHFTVGPSRGLHMNPEGAHHDIDEWWDDSIGDLLSWLFSVQHFDTFIVNYAWLSKAFEFAPPTVMKILDTHDKISGRRELLAAHGIAPEYFFTTEEQEAAALKRAHLVWAIKEEERAHFERLSKTPVVSMPYLDAAQALERAAPDPEGCLRVGFLAARNSINLVNVTKFLEVAEPIFREAFAPLKFVIAGSICDLMGKVEGPFVELRGRVGEADDFYRTVDCVAVPMVFSTGLKIKTGEALSAGLPVVATAHAFEGYQPADALHALPDFEAMARALVDLSFAPRSRLDELAAASLRAHAATAKLIAESFARTRALVREKQKSIVLAVDSRAFLRGGIFNLALRSMHDYLRHLGGVTVLAVKGSAEHLLANESTVDAFGRVLVAADLPGAAGHEADLAAMRVGAVDVGAYLAAKGAKVLVIDALHKAFFEPAAAVAAFSRVEMIALSEGRADFAVPGQAFNRAFVVSPSYSRVVAEAQTATSAEIMLAPCFSRGENLRLSLPAYAGSPRVVLLGAPGSQAMTLALALAQSWRMGATVVCPIGFAGGAGMNGGASYAAAADYIELLIKGETLAPLFALDLSGGAPGLQLVREILERVRIPVATAGNAGWLRSYGISTFPAAISTEFELFEIFRLFASDPRIAAHPALHGIHAIPESDRGWATMWTFCRRLFETEDAEFA